MIFLSSNDQKWVDDMVLIRLDKQPERITWATNHLRH
jgi:hypothetical protein